MSEPDESIDVSCYSTQEWARVGKLLRERRLQLRMTIEEVAEEGHTSPVSVSALEEGERTSYRQLTLAKVAHGLGWSGNSILRLLAGGEPEEQTVDNALSDGRFANLEERMAAIEAQIKKLAPEDSPSLPDTE